MGSDLELSTRVRDGRYRRAEGGFPLLSPLVQCASVLSLQLLDLFTLLLPELLLPRLDCRALLDDFFHFCGVLRYSHGSGLFVVIELHFVGGPRPVGVSNTRNSRRVAWTLSALSDAQMHETRTK